MVTVVVAIVMMVVMMVIQVVTKLPSGSGFLEEGEVPTRVRQGSLSLAREGKSQEPGTSFSSAAWPCFGLGVSKVKDQGLGLDWVESGKRGERLPWL